MTEGSIFLALKKNLFLIALEKWNLFLFNRMIKKNWPMYYRLGVRFKSVSDDLKKLKVVFPFNRKTKGFGDTHFGGAIYAFVDPLYVFSISKNLGPEYLVLDTKAEIDFLKASNSDLYAEIEVLKEDLEKMQEECKSNKKTTRKYSIEVLDANFQKIAIVQKTIYIRAKSRFLKTPEKR
ncbi:PaaI family thioesterase [Leptospira sarikeiensis]|uniref:DUF4442 domain-containing protein n=1 Tax=Leptospira sarikeiensis TaxID=2484943 RepID=A0A4R9K4X8_9LEPT|nr:DUF4442 domain-containing protein [Leptospira sarikeiensis]TGL60588.1 DUF4442 domain-containing protein [Leptospira sarikeiensis]